MIRLPRVFPAVLGVVDEQDAAHQEPQGSGGQQHFLIQLHRVCQRDHREHHRQQAEPGGRLGTGELEGEGGGEVPGQGGGADGKDLSGEGHDRRVGGVGVIGQHQPNAGHEAGDEGRQRPTAAVAVAQDHKEDGRRGAEHQNAQEQQEGLGLE